MTKLSEVFHLEAQVEKVLEDIKNEVVEAVHTAPALPGVTPISTRPAFALVMFSALKNGRNMAPETYMQSEQAKAVDARIRNCRSLKTFVATVREMVEIKRVKMPIAQNHWITLNDSTLAVLQNMLDEWNEQ